MEKSQDACSLKDEPETNILEAGADYVISSLAELKEIIDKISNIEVITPENSAPVSVKEEILEKII